MTLIVVDPIELNVASETLRSCAAETADIGSQLWACAQCAMPPDLEAAINNIVSTGDRVLDGTAAVFQVRATDLANRAAIAANDPIAATSVATSPATAGVWGVIAATTVGGGGGPFGDGGGFFTGTGFQAIATTTVGSGGGPFGDGGGFYTGFGSNVIAATTVGGGGGPFGDGAGYYTGLGTGSRRYDGPLGGVLALAEVGQNFRDRTQATIDAIVRNPYASPAAIQIALNAQGALGDSISHSIAPSVSELKDRYGPLSDSEINAISPHTLPRSTNLFEGL
jgi:hypothetical protein